MVGFAFIFVYRLRTVGAYISRIVGAHNRAHAQYLNVALGALIIRLHLSAHQRQDNLLGFRRCYVLDYATGFATQDAPRSSETS